MRDFIAGIVGGMIFWLYLSSLIGYPPKHCNYIVPIKNVAHSYGCSEYPYPITYKK